MRTAPSNDWSWVTAEIEPIVIEKLLKRAQDPSLSALGHEEAMNSLVKIGHGETLQRLVDEYDPTTSRNPLDWADERALPYLIPKLKSASTEVPPMTSDIYYHSTLETFYFMVVRIIQKSPAFPPETKEWATAMENNNYKQGREQRVKLLEQWWKENQSAILEKRYGDATWLPRKKGKPYYLSNEEYLTEQADQQQQRIKRRTTVNQGKATSDEIAKNPSDKTLMGVLLALGLLMVGWAGWKLKSRAMR